MAIPTPVNGQITDSVTQANVKVVADAPAMAMGAIYQSLAHSTGILYENAASAQQQLAIAAQAPPNPAPGGQLAQSDRRRGDVCRLLHRARQRAVAAA
jgi:Killing trait